MWRLKLCSTQTVRILLVDKEGLEWKSCHRWSVQYTCILCCDFLMIHTYDTHPPGERFFSKSWGIDASSSASLYAVSRTPNPEERPPPTWSKQICYYNILTAMHWTWNLINNPQLYTPMWKSFKKNTNSV